MNKEEDWGHEPPVTDQVPKLHQLSKLVRTVLKSLIDLGQDVVLASYLHSDCVVKQLGVKELLHWILDGGREQAVDRADVLEVGKDLLDLVQEG